MKYHSMAAAILPLSLLLLTVSAPATLPAPAAPTSSPLFVSTSSAATVTFLGGATVTQIPTPGLQDPAPAPPKFTSSNDGQDRGCSANNGAGGEGFCSLKSGSNDTCSASGQNSACSSMGGGNNFCSSNGGGKQGQCSTMNGPSIDCSSAGGKNNQCSAKASGNCSVYGPGGNGPGEHQTCSSHKYPANAAGGSTCSAYGAGSFCSVKKGTKNAECTVSRMWPGGGHCSSMDANGEPATSGGGKCSVIDGENVEGPTNGTCDGDGIPDVITAGPYEPGDGLWD